MSILSYFYFKSHIMKTRSWFVAGGASVLVAAIVVVFVLYPWKQSRTTSFTPDQISQAYQQYVQAFTSGVISSRSTILVVFADDVVDSALFASLDPKKLFKFKPDIIGETFRVNNRTVEFRPSNVLPSGEFFQAKLQLSTLFELPDSMSVFEFGFNVMKQEFEVEVLNHKAYNNKDLALERLFGTLRTSDFASEEAVEGVVGVTQNGLELPVTWTHEDGGKIHYFRADSIIRATSAGEVMVCWNGEPIGADQHGEERVVIPALDQFIFLKARMLQDPEQYIIIQFSDPLDPKQNLRGLFSVGGVRDLRYAVEDNELKIYPQELRGDSVQLVIEAAVRNLSGKTLGSRITDSSLQTHAGNGVVTRLPVVVTMPAVRFLGDGVIMPGSSGLLFPFEAVNLKAVDIMVIRIFEKNILQFLQVNDLNGSNELYRVSRVVLKKRIPLANVLDYGSWNRFSIDLNDLIKAEPGAIYNIQLSFRKDYSTYPCGQTNAIRDEPILMMAYDPDSINDRNWSYYSNYTYYNYEDYDWQDRDNPCKPTYYMNKSISRNVFASNLGVIAKMGSGNRCHVYITNLLTAQPVPDAKIEIFNYQQLKLGEVRSNSEGIAVINLSRQPFFIVVSQGKETGYLRLTDGGVLSLSMFDVGGEVVQHGIKGFLYGERGIWRPGDSLFLTFILDDPTGTLPRDHPVNFSFYNPRGQLMKSLVKSPTLGNFYTFQVATATDAPTGNWMAKVKVGGAEFKKLLKIETVKPNRLKILLDVPGNKLVAGSIPDLTMKVNWLTGPIAANLNATVNLTLTKSSSTFTKFPGYIFDFPFSGFSSENTTIFTGRLNEQGEAKFIPGIHLSASAPGVLKANFETMVFEEGGGFSVDRFSVPYFPYASFAGVSVPQPPKRSYALVAGKAYDISLINITAEEAIVPSNKLKVEVFKLDWRWWWDDTESGYSASFIANQSHNLKATQIVQTSDGRASYRFITNREEWGRYLIKVTDMTSGHSAGKVIYVDWEGYFRMPGGEKQAATMLIFTSDKPKYRVGDKVKLSIPSSAGGRVLVTLENGSKVLRSIWAPSTKGQTDITFEVTNEMAPNIYAFVTLLQPHSQTVNDLPIRLYGVLPILVENSGTHLKPEIEMKEVLVPGTDATISVKEASGRSMTYTLAVVDQGLLDLTRFKTPDAWNAFYCREALGVKSWDLFDQVMGAYSGELQRILSIGGDEEAALQGSLKANRFVPMVRFLGVFQLKKGQTRAHTFRMPDYIGAVRVMVVAGEGESFGSAEKSAFVRKPLMVLGTLPRVLGPGETVKLPVTVFAMEQKVKEVEVSIKPNAFFIVVGKASQQITFTTPGEQVAMFELQVKPQVGVGTVEIEATGGGERSSQTIEIDIRNPNPPISFVISKAISPGDTWSAPFKPIGMAGTNSGSVELSTIPPMNLEKWMNYLIHYPYGCIEQTVSAAFPQLYLNTMMDLSAERKQEIETNTREAIKRLNSFQVPGGGFSMWPGSVYPSDWGTNYAGHFLIEAEKQGYAVSGNLFGNWKAFQRRKAATWEANLSYSNNDLIQAYRLFTLALAGDPDLGAMNRLREWNDLSNTARWYLAGAYQKAGKPEVAMALIERASHDVNPYNELSGTFGSTLRDQAIIAEVLCLMNMRTKATPLVQEIAGKLAGNGWYSTQTTAYALMAIAEYAGNHDESGVTASYRFGRDKMQYITSSKSLALIGIPERNTSPPGSVEVKNTGKGVLFVQLILNGIPPPGLETAASNDLKISVKWMDLKERPIDPKQLPQGMTFMVEVTITNPGLRGNYEQLALAQIFPSGWEIINARMSAMAKAGETNSQFDYQYIGDDRVNTFFSLNAGKSKRFRIMLNTTYLGRFYLPATSCETMYNHTIYARDAGEWVEVVR